MKPLYCYTTIFTIPISKFAQTCMAMALTLSRGTQRIGKLLSAPSLPSLPRPPPCHLRLLLHAETNPTATPYLISLLPLCCCHRRWWVRPHCQILSLYAALPQPLHLASSSKNAQNQKKKLQRRKRELKAFDLSALSESIPRLEASEQKSFAAKVVESKLQV
ncbi:unnamed protein product [Citrullus colocynthis]|uniref:Uncharacterized protein n=1 Tax=Citrullus colocynthis TaxID=252529 RepID=A0ABP0YMZ3_9ROSI